jgi:hypothetical protein
MHQLQAMRVAVNKYSMQFTLESACNTAAMRRLRHAAGSKPCAWVMRLGLRA